MIRREASDAPTAGAQWILISQVDHAHLSGALAEHWGAGGVQPLVARDELLWAITHHDDGWADWEREPHVEPRLARPRAFTEMDLPQSLEIWTRSIAAAAERGSLAGYVVAGHFCALLRRFDFNWRRDERNVADGERFLATFENLMDGCLQAWLADDPLRHTLPDARLALAQLQLFDALSLWFCCARETAAEAMETPAGATITLTPRPQPDRGQPQLVEFSPWPFTCGPMNLEIPARAVPVRRYESRADLAAIPLQAVQLRWRLQPPPVKS
ncbi:MAG: DUF3891 family protein [Pirellulales bacterium]